MYAIKCISLYIMWVGVIGTAKYVDFARWAQELPGWAFVVLMLVGGAVFIVTNEIDEF